MVTVSKFHDDTFTSQDYLSLLQGDGVNLYYQCTSDRYYGAGEPIELDFCEDHSSGDELIKSFKWEKNAPYVEIDSRWDKMIELLRSYYSDDVIEEMHSYELNDRYYNIWGNSTGETMCDALYRYLSNGIRDEGMDWDITQDEFRAEFNALKSALWAAIDKKLANRKYYTFQLGTYDATWHYLVEVTNDEITPDVVTGDEREMQAILDGEVYVVSGSNVFGDEDSCGGYIGDNAADEAVEDMAANLTQLAEEKLAHLKNVCSYVNPDNYTFVYQGASYCFDEYNKVFN